MLKKLSFAIISVFISLLLLLVSCDSEREASLSRSENKKASEIYTEASNNKNEVPQSDVSAEITFREKLEKLLNDAEKEGHDKNTLVWVIPYHVPESLLPAKGILEPEINRMLKEKQKQYKIRFLILPTTDEGDIFKAANILNKLRERDIQADLISIPQSSMGAAPKSGLYNYAECCEAGLLKELDKIEAAAVKGVPEQALACLFYKGKLFGIFNDNIYLKCTEYNSEILEQCSIDENSINPDPAKNIEIFRKIKTETKAVPYVVFSPADYLYSNLNFVTTNCGFGVNEAGEMIYALDNPDFIEYYKFLCLLKSEDLIGFQEQIRTNKSTFFSMAGSALGTKNFRYKNFYDENLIVVPDIAHSEWGLVYTNPKAVGISSWSRNADNALDFLRMIFEDNDMANLIRYGVEGKHFTLKDGKAYSEEKYRMFFNTFSEFFGGNSYMSYPDYSEDIDKKETAEEKAGRFIEPMLCGFCFNTMNIKNEINACQMILDSPSPEYFSKPAIKKFMSLEYENERDIDRTLSEVKELYKKAGGGKIIEEYNRQYKKFRAENAAQ